MAPWFRADDSLTTKVETTRIPRAIRPAVIGLWVLAGTWSAKELTDGHVPAHMIDELAGTQEQARALVAAGYWRAVEDGFQFVEWGPTQPLREAVLEARRKNAEKVKGWRDRNRPSNPVTNDDTNPDVTPPPVPSLTHTPSQESVQAEPARAAPNEFADWWILYPRKQGKKDAEKAYAIARRTTDAKTLREGAQAYALLHSGDDKNFLKLPGGWLRDRRWEDEVIPPSPEKETVEQQTARIIGLGMRISAHERNLQTVWEFAEAERAEGDVFIQGPGGDYVPAEPLALTSGMCDVHSGYPDTVISPCAACARESASEMAS